MKLFLSSLIIFPICVISMLAQDLKEMAFGPYISYKAGISAVNTPKGRKNGVAFNKIPDFGISAYVPMSRTSNLGISTDIGYATYSYLMKAVHFDKEYQFNHSYVSVNPNFYFGGFMLGLNVAIPLSSDYDGTEVKTSIQNTMFELKIGGMINIFSDETGDLNFFIIGGYALNGIYNDFPKDDPVLIPTDERVTNVHNPRAASLGIGFNFLFNLKKKEKVDEVF